MPAQSESYAVPSGSSLSAGRRLIPAWVPAAGTVVDVGLNTVTSVMGSDTTVAGMFTAWCGDAYSAEYGKYGSILYNGGGHGDRASPVTYRYDIETRLCSKITPDVSVYYHADTYCADTATGWLWAASDGTDVQVGHPFVMHNYANLIALPSNAMAGDAPNGWLVTLGRGSMPLAGQLQTLATHKLALGVSGVWSFAGAPVTQRNAHAYTLHDTRRSRLIGVNGDNAFATSLLTYDLATGTPGTMPFTGGSYNGYYHIGKYSESLDLYISARWTGAMAFDVIDPVTAIHTKPTVIGTLPASNYEGAWDWDETHSRMVLLVDADNSAYTLTPTDDPRTDPWLCEKHLLTGTVRTHAGSTPAYTRLHHIPSLDAFVWSPAANVPAQMFRIL